MGQRHRDSQFNVGRSQASPRRDPSDSDKREGWEAAATGHYVRKGGRQREIHIVWKNPKLSELLRANGFILVAGPPEHWFIRIHTTNSGYYGVPRRRDRPARTNPRGSPNQKEDPAVMRARDQASYLAG